MPTEKSTVEQILSIKRGAYADALQFVLSDKVEGGYSDDPNDPGGPTNHGIALNEVLRASIAGEIPTRIILLLDADQNGAIDARDAKLWTKEIAAAYFEACYWNKIQGDALPSFLALMTFDSAINEGVPRAIRHLQTTLGVEVDGVIGPETLAAADHVALSAADREDAIVTFAGRRLERYRALSNADRFFFGWSRRVVRISILASAD